MATWKILDLTDHRGEMGPWFLDQLGATVVKVDTPADPAAGYEFDRAVYRITDHCVAVDLTDRDAARSTLLHWLAWCEIVFYSAPNGLLDELGISEADLVGSNSRLVRVAISPFGLDGPRSEQPSSELTIAALGGPVSLQGSADRAPLKMSVNQVWRHAGMEAAAAALVAHRRMQQTGSPQFVDVSAQAAMTWTMLNAMEAAAVQGWDFERDGSIGQTGTDFHHATRDGYTVNNVSGRGMLALAPWLVEEGIVPESWLKIDYKSLDRRLATGLEAEISYQDIERAMNELCARYGKELLLKEGLKRGCTFAPVNTLADLLDMDHLAARKFWQVTADGHRKVGPAVLFEGERCAMPGLSKITPDTSDVRKTKGSSSGSSPGLPLAGLKVADFSWIGVGPISTKALADHGATVVRIESALRPDGLRLQGPFKDGEVGKNRSHFFGTFNTSKLSMTLDLSSEQGLEIARQMADWADIVIDSFRPGTMTKLGLGPDVIHASNPTAIVLTTSLMGNSGPLSNMAGFGFHAAGIAGFTELVGWPDRSPDGPWVAYTDVIAPRFLTTILLAALHAREDSGKGMTIEASQFEIGLQFLAPELEKYQVTGVASSRVGNRDHHIAPQGVYPCSGDDSWCAISVTDNEIWQKLVGVMGSPDAVAGRFDELELRISHHDDIDRYIADWTKKRGAKEIEQLLRDAGVPAGVVQRSSDLLVDPQYEFRSFYHQLEHSETGTLPYAGHQYRIRGYEHGPRFAPPVLGQHTRQVLEEILGLDAVRIAELEAAGVLK